VPTLVYLAKNTIGGGEYIGVTNRTLMIRKKEHRNDATGGKKSYCRKFHAAIRKYGIDAFEWSVMAVFDDRRDALSYEIKQIAERKPRYNITAGGEGVIAPRTEQWCKRISEALKRRGISDAQKAAMKAARPPDLGMKPVICIEDDRLFPSIKAAAEAYGVRPQSISCAIHGWGRQKRSAGKSFAFAP
jgi:hypothetical protein